MKQVILYVITFSQYEIPSNYSITSYFPMSEKAKEGNVRKKLPKCIRFHIPFGFIMPIASANTRKHEANGVTLGDVCCFETLHGGFCCPLISYILV